MIKKRFPDLKAPVKPAPVHQAGGDETMFELCKRRKKSLTIYYEKLKAKCEHLSCLYVRKNKRKIIEKHKTMACLGLVQKAFGSPSQKGNIKISAARLNAKLKASGLFQVKLVEKQQGKDAKLPSVGVKGLEGAERLLKVLKPYINIERVRKAAIMALKKNTDVKDIFDRTVDTWGTLLQYFENPKSLKKMATDDFFSLKYAAYKIFGDMNLLFRLAEKAIQVYKFTVPYI